MIYLDNAATSWPKPPVVAEAMTRFMSDVGANPGRAAHRLAIESGRVVYGAREAVAELFHAADPLRVVFGPNVTEALNLALRGLLRPGDHVVTSSMEHNSVMRPLRALEREKVRLTVIPCSPQGELNSADIEAAIQPDTALIVLNHASNVVGTILPVAEVGRIARAHGIPLLVDAAQTGGAYPIDMLADGIDLLAFTGHKSLYGPMGTGGLIIGERVETAALQPLTRGGTGSRSELEEQPDFAPDRYESGTPNVVGLAGLEAGVRWVLARGVAAIRSHELALTTQLINGLREIPGRDGVWHAGPQPADGHRLLYPRGPRSGRRESAPGRRVRDHVPRRAALLARRTPHHRHVSRGHRALWVGRVQYAGRDRRGAGRCARAGTRRRLGETLSLERVLLL